jgi:hypothetical protein
VKRFELLGLPGCAEEAIKTFHRRGTVAFLIR